MQKGSEPAPEFQLPRRSKVRSIAIRTLLHLAFLLIALGCLAAFEHFRIDGPAAAAWVSLAAGAGFGFMPARDLVRVFFKVEGTTLHLVHVLGGLGLIALPVTGAIGAAPVLTHAAMAPFAMMGAAQALMHQNQPRNAKQAAAMQRFASSLPEVAIFANPKNLASPANAQRAVAVLNDILSKAQALGQTELEADPGFQSALRQVSTRIGAGMGLDAVDLVLRRMAASPATAGAVPGLRQKLALARHSVEGKR